MRIRLPANEWSPRPYQRRLWAYLENGGRRAVGVWHRRAGKDEVALNWAAVAANDVGAPTSIGRVGNYWHMLPEAAQARKVIWEAVNPHTGRRRIEEAFPQELRENTRDSDMLIRFRNGSTWQVVGSDNYNSLVGAAPVGIVFSEWALADPNAWAYLSPILAENGGWALFIYTSRGRNHGYNTFKSAEADATWYAERLTADQTGAITPELLAQQRRNYVDLYGEDQGDAFYQQEFYCSFEAAILGAYYGKVLTDAEAGGRISNVPWDPGIPVHTAWDLGIGDSTAIWFAQLVGREVRLIDYYQSSGVGLDHYVSVLQSKPYVYGDCALPHDAEAKELGTGRTRAETLDRLGVKNIQILPRHRLEDGINACRLLIPRCWFDAEKCERGIEALRQYRRAWDEEARAFSNRPEHDWTSHPADALRYLAMSPAIYREPTPEWVRKNRVRSRSPMAG